MRIRKNSSRLLWPLYSNGKHQTPSACQPAWSPPAHDAHDVVVKKGDAVTTNKICNPKPSLEGLCGSNKDAKMEDNYKDYLVHICCRDEFKCNCVSLRKLDEELKIDDMLEKCTSNKHMAVKKMKPDVFLKEKMDEDGKIMSMKALEDSNNGKKCKENVIVTDTWTNSKLDKVKDLVSEVVTSASASTSSNPRKRKSVAYGSGKDHIYYTQVGVSLVMERRVRSKKNY